MDQYRNIVDCRKASKKNTRHYSRDYCSVFIYPLICGQASKPVQILEFNNDGETEFHWGSAGRQPFGNAGERQTFGNPGPGLMTTTAVDVDQAIAGTAWQTLQSETVLYTALVITKSFSSHFGVFGPQWGSEIWASLYFE